MAHHSHDKHHKTAHSPRSKDAPIGIVKQRSTLATLLVYGVALFFVLAALVVVAYFLFA
jgi:hypothetical protein